MNKKNFFGLVFILLMFFGLSIGLCAQEIPANISPETVQNAIKNNPQLQNLSPQEIQKGLKILNNKEQQKIGSPLNNQSSNSSSNKKSNKIEISEHKNATQVNEENSFFNRYMEKNSGNLHVSLKNMKPFGYSLFKRSPDKPLFIQPVPPSYIIGPGDEIQVLLWGRINAQYTLKVGADGRIFFPNIGPLMVAGMKYSKMQSFLAEQAKRITGTNVSITLYRLHQIQVFVLGAVKKPGLYSVPAMSTIMNALIASGGPTLRGSLRKIELKRNNKVIDMLDVYDLLVRGDRSHDLILRNNDVVFVPLVGPLIGVAGNVKRPGIYELKSESNLADVIKLAGGLLPNATSQIIQVVRFKEHKWQIIKDINFSHKKEVKNFKVKDGDLIKIFSVITQPINSVKLAGNVVRPGTYSYYPGMKLSSIIKSMNDLLPQTYLNYALIKRYVMNTGQTKLVPFDLRKIIDKKFDIELRPLDTIYIFPRGMFIQEPQYSIYGEVRQPGTYKIWDNNFRVKDLIMKAGGLKESAYLKDAEIISFEPLDNGSLAEISHKHINLYLAINGDKKNNILLKPYDRVFIRKIPGWDDTINVTIKGEVKFPGVYTLKKGARLSDLIEKAGGYKDDAYLEGAEYISPAAQKIQQQALKDLVNKLQSEIFLSSSKVSQKSLSVEETQSAQVQMMGAEKFINSLKRLKAKGRIVIRLAPVRILKGSPYDIQLGNGVTVIIPREKNMINVVGSVMSPSTFIYSPNFTWKDYIRMAGGFTEFANEDNVFVLKVDGSAYQVSKGPVEWNPFKSRWEVTAFNKKGKLEPGDTIVVPAKVQYTPWIRNVKDITQILMQIAVTTGVIFRLY